MAENAEQHTPPSEQADELYRHIEGMHDSLDEHVTGDDVLRLLVDALSMAQSLRGSLTAHDARVKAEARESAFRDAARYFAGGLHCADMRTTPEETVRDLRRMADQEQEARR